MADLRADGKPYVGYPPGRGMPRYTDPGFRQAAAAYMNNVFDTFPDLDAIAVGPPDGGVKMDARDLGRKAGQDVTAEFGAPVRKLRPGDTILLQARYELTGGTYYGER